ncbi:MAG TPA: LCP family protein, partial [Candidatus Nanopelagicales bacterium]|nr:LCP family protein [Candidatus Nanopelagicales bacterium]
HEVLRDTLYHHPVPTPSHDRRRSVARTAAAVLAAFALLATTGSAFGWAAVNRLQDNITVDNSADGLLGTAPPGTAPVAVNAQTGYQAENILLIGSDTRSGQGAGYGNEADTSSGNGQSDTAILLHISADRTNAFGISIPRDSWVTRPSCNPDGSTDGSLVTGKFNAAYSAGGRKCVVRAVKYLTGVRIDHFVEVDFRGFKKIVDALGGVQICTTRPLQDPVRRVGNGWEGSGLDLKEGTQTISGDQAIAFVRARHIIGDDGSADIGRMDRQQAFISSIIRSATDSGLLTDLPRLYNVLSAVTSSLTVDSGLSGDALQQFVLSLQGMSPADVTFRTVPWVPRGDNSNVLWDTAKADPIWQAMKDDTPWPVKSTAPASGKPLKTAPQDISVQVLNGSGTPGLATKAARQLAKQGFVIAGVGNATTTDHTVTSLEYDTGYNQSARTLAYSAHVTDKTAVSGHGATLTLTVGSDWTKPAHAVVKDGSTDVGRSAADSTCIS